MRRVIPIALFGLLLLGSCRAQKETPARHDDPAAAAVSPEGEEAPSVNPDDEEVPTITPQRKMYTD